MSPIFERLDRLRVRRNLTWDALALELGVDRSLFFHVKSGKRNLSAKVLFRLEQMEIDSGLIASDPLNSTALVQEIPPLGQEKELSKSLRSEAKKLREMADRLEDQADAIDSKIF